MAMSTVSIPEKYTATQTVNHWGKEHTVTPVVATEQHGDGKVLLAVQPLNTRPNYYLIRVDSSVSRMEQGSDEFLDTLDDEIVPLLQEEFLEKESERERLADDLRERGIEPTSSNTDLNGNEDRLGWPVFDEDAGWGWWVVATLVFGEWKE